MHEVSTLELKKYGGSERFDSFVLFQVRNNIYSNLINTIIRRNIMIKLLKEEERLLISYVI